MIVPIEKSCQAEVQFRRRFVTMKIHVFMLHGPPKTLDIHVVDPAAFAVHAVFRFEIVGHLKEFSTRKLTPLIRVENLRFSKVRQGFLQGLDAKCRVHRVRQSPRQNHPAVPVDNRRQIHESLGQTDVRDVRRPNLVDPYDIDAAEQIRELRVFRVRDRRASFRVRRGQVHRLHEPMGLVSADAELLAESPGTVVRMLRVKTVDSVHQFEFFRRHGNGFVVRNRFKITASN